GAGGGARAPAGRRGRPGRDGRPGSEGGQRLRLAGGGHPGAGGLRQRDRGGESGRRAGRDGAGNRRRGGGRRHRRPARALTGPRAPGCATGLYHAGMDWWVWVGLAALLVTAYLTWLAARVGRLHRRAASAGVALDASLVR